MGRYIAAWQNDGSGWKLAALLGIGLTGAAATILPAGLGPMRLAPLAPEGPTARFISADLDFARLAGDSGAARALMRWAAPDAITMGGGLLQRGPATILQGVDGAARWRWHPVLAGASPDGDLGFTVGESEIATDGAPTSYGKYLTIWRRMPDGSSRFLTDGGNARPATP